MKKPVLLIGSLVLHVSLMTSAFGIDTGSRDILRLSTGGYSNGEWAVAVHVINDDPLVGLDIPIRFGQPGDPIELLRVSFTQRVQDWDVMHAAIDNQNKTVILGLISELGRVRSNPELENADLSTSEIAHLLFRVDDSYEASFEPFTTMRPQHRLTFVYNRWENATPYVESFEPRFELDENSQKVHFLPAEYALSENVPNPFNASTSFTLSLPEASDYTIRIYNVAGQLVKNYEGHMEAGVRTITWDGTNNHGSQVASGVYFYRADAGSFAEIHRMMLLK